MACLLCRSGFCPVKSVENALAMFRIDVRRASEVASSPVILRRFMWARSDFGLRFVDQPAQSRIAARRTEYPRGATSGPPSTKAPGPAGARQALRP